MGRVALGRALVGTFKVCSFDRQTRKTLRHVVVQLPSKPATLVLVSGDEPSGESFRLALGTAAAGALQQQRGDQRGLQDDCRRGRNDGGTVLFP